MEQYRVIREATWKDQHTPPVLHLCPKKLYVIEDPKKAFEFAMNELSNKATVGLSMQGKNLSRTGETMFSLLFLIFSSSCVFSFHNLHTRISLELLKR